ncbi:MAG: hypothetical protein H0V56_09750 [Chthoniobacterales bacterium]|nr:hypothetical protein [Chthoniobacterales bacterium]
MKTSLPSLLVAAAFASGAMSALDASAQTLPINYHLQLQVRANTGGTAYNLPNGSTFNSVSVSLNDSGEIAAKVNTVGQTVSPGVFFGGHGVGGLVHDAGDNEAITGDAFLNNNNQITWTRSLSTNNADNGVWRYNRATATAALLTNGPLGATSYTNPRLNDLGMLGTRVRFNTPQALMSYNPATNAWINYVTENSGDPNSPYSFIYAPAFNNNHRLAAQVNLTSQASTFKELRIWNPNGTSVLVASGDSSTGPTFYAFDNSISMNNYDQVAFTTRTSTAAAGRRIVVSDGVTTQMFPTVSSGSGFTSIDFFAPVINDNARVAFRGNDNQATPRDSVFVTDGTTFQRIAGVGDTLMTDAGPRVVGFLMGGVDINIHGAVAFGVQFTSASGGGNAIYVAYPQIQPLMAVSRKIHGDAGPFDVVLPLTGTPGVESRRGSGKNFNQHQVVITFAAPVTFGSAMVTSGTGAVDTATIQGNQVMLELSGVANAQTLQVTLFNVYDGANTSHVVIPLSVLAGDVNGNGTVNSADVAQAKSQVGITNSTNFRADVVPNGAVNATDIAFVKSRAGTSLP